MIDVRGEPQESMVHWSLPYALTILPTYRCSAACNHCCFQSNPHIAHRAPQDRLLRYIEDAKSLNTIRLVCLSGGEAFLLGKDLVELVEKASDCGFYTRVVTNGFWASTDQEAERRLRALVGAGLREINFSTGDDHQQFVPLERVITAMNVSMRLGLDMGLMIEDGAGRKSTKKEVLDLALAHPNLHAAMTADKISIIESPWIGFSPTVSQPVQTKTRTVNKRNLASRESCKSILTTIVISPTEELGMCCGLPRESLRDLTVGSLLTRSLPEMVDEGLHDFMKIWLFIEGPERILSWAAEYDPTIEWEDLYAHNCDACRAMYLDSRVQDVIAEHYRDKYEEILSIYALYVAGSQNPNPRKIGGDGLVDELRHSTDRSDLIQRRPPSKSLGSLVQIDA